MNKILLWLIILGMVVGGWMLYVNSSEKPKTTNAQQSPGPTATTKSEESSNPEESSKTKKANEKYESNKLRFQMICKRRKINILSMTDIPRGILVKFETTEQNAPGQLLDELIQSQLMRDMEEVHRSGYKDKSLMTHFVLEYKIFWY